MSDCWFHLAGSRSISDCRMFLVKLWERLSAIQTSGRLVPFCLGKCPIGPYQFLSSRLVEGGSGQCHVQIRRNLGRGLGDCWPLRLYEAAWLGRLRCALRFAKKIARSSAESSLGKHLRAPCEASPQGKVGTQAFLLGSGLTRYSVWR